MKNNDLDDLLKTKLKILQDQTLDNSFVDEVMQRLDIEANPVQTETPNQVEIPTPAVGLNRKLVLILGLLLGTGAAAPAWLRLDEVLVHLQIQNVTEMFAGMRSQLSELTANFNIPSSLDLAAFNSSLTWDPTIFSLIIVAMLMSTLVVLPTLQD